MRGGSLRQPGDEAGTETEIPEQIDRAEEGQDEDVLPNTLRGLAAGTSTTQKTAASAFCAELDTCRAATSRANRARIARRTVSLTWGSQPEGAELASGARGDDMVL